MSPTLPITPGSTSRTSKPSASVSTRSRLRAKHHQSPTPSPFATPKSKFKSRTHSTSHSKNKATKERPVVFGNNSPLHFFPDVKELVKADHYAASTGSLLMVSGPNIIEIFKAYMESEPLIPYFSFEKISQETWSKLLLTLQDCFLDILRRHLSLIFYPKKEGFDEYALTVNGEEFDVVVKRLRVHHLLRLFSILGLITDPKFKGQHFHEEEKHFLSRMVENMLKWIAEKQQSKTTQRMP
ncbi:hypothetical protein GEMRC1_003492 [Eukaryota sp. GEM-RC1]